MEYWEKISGYNTNYEISNHGNIRNIRSGKNLSGSIDSHGYKYVFLTKIKKHKFHNIHRLVAIAFISNPEGKPQVNHIDGNKTNNSIPNLELVTRAENRKHASEVLGRWNGESNGMAKLTKDSVDKIRQLAVDGFENKEIALMYNMNANYINDIIKRRAWKHV